MSKLYGVYHMMEMAWDNCGTYTEFDLIAVFTNEDTARTYARRWSDPYFYDRSRGLKCGLLVYKALPDICTDVNIPPDELACMWHYRRDHLNEDVDD